jgi:hypothetical protein
MGDIARNFLHSRHQALDLVEHLVETDGQLVDLVAGTRNGEPFRKVAFHDGAAGGGDQIDAMEKIAAHDEAAEQTEQHGEAEGEEERAANERAQLAPFLDITADDQHRPIGKSQVIGPGAAVADTFEGLHEIGKLDPPLPLDRLLGKAVEIAGKAAAEIIGQQIHRAWILLAATADRLGETFHAVLGELLGKHADLGAHGLLNLLLDKQSGVPIDVGENNADGESEYGEIKSGEPECRSLQKLQTNWHGSCIRHRAPSAAWVPGNPCRSWCAGGKCAHR